MRPFVIAALDARWRRAWAGVAVALGMLTCYFAFRPEPAQVMPEGTDKLQHLLAFAVMTPAWQLATGCRRELAMRVATGLAAFGGFIELVQLRIPGRSGEFADWLADAAGIALGWAFASALRRFAVAPTHPGRPD